MMMMVKSYSCYSLSGSDDQMTDVERSLSGNAKGKGAERREGKGRLCSFLQRPNSVSLIIFPWSKVVLSVSV